MKNHTQTTKKTAFAAFTSRIKFIAQADKRHCSVTRSIPRLYVRRRLCSAFWWVKLPSHQIFRSLSAANSGSSPAPVGLLRAASAPPCGCFWSCLCTAGGRDNYCILSVQPGIVSCARSCCSRSNFSKRYIGTLISGHFLVYYISFFWLFQLQ